MALIKFYSAGQVGIVKDVAPHELPPPAWSDGQNVIFRDGKIIRRGGFQQVFGTPTVVPFWTMFTFTATNAFWVYGNQTKLYGTNGALHSDLTRAVGGDYSMNIDQLWNGGILGGIPVITNGVDVPQAWTPISLGQRFANLVNWTATDRARVIKPYKNFLVALGITRSGTFFPHMVIWSHAASPGALPSSWDATDPTNLAGEAELLDEMPGEIRDALALRDSLIVYKDNSVHGITYVGPPSVMRLFPILSNIGILSTHCVALVKEGRAHIFATGDDLVVFDGQNVESVLNDRWKKFLEDNLELAWAQRSQVVAVPRTTEAWFLFPFKGTTSPSHALVWNWQENTITLRQLPVVAWFAGLGAVTAIGDTWDVDSQTWDADSSLWDVQTFRANFLELLVGATSPAAFYAMERSQQNNGVDYLAYVTRTGLACIGQDRVTGQIKSDPSIWKLVNRVYLKAHGGPVDVTVGGQETPEHNVVWGPTKRFFPGVTRFLDFEFATPLIALKFEMPTGAESTIDAFDIDLEPLGEH